MWLSILLSVPLVVAQAGTRAVYLDGGEAHEVMRHERLADGRRSVTLTHPRTGAPIAATLGDEALVQLAPGQGAGALTHAHLTPVREVSPTLRIWQVRGQRGEDGLAVASRLAVPPAGIVAAAPDLAFAHVRASSAFVPPPNDPRYAGQWFFAQLDMNHAWARETGAATTTVVVVDDGCDLKHPDLVDKLDPGTDVFSNDSDPSYAPGTTGNNHGTSCAGLVGASTNNGLGVAGACPGCRLRCVRLLGGDGVAIPLSADLAAFQFALDNNAAVVSNSWGYKGSVPVPDMLRQILEKVYDSGRGGKGAVVVFAAGNDDRALADDEINNVRGVVTVGAVDNFGELTSYSNHGASVALVSPTGTLTTDISGAEGSNPGDYLANFSGTSSACPIVAGIVGLLASAAPDKTSAQLVDALLGSTTQSMFATPDATGHDDFYGRGEVRPVNALRLLAGEVLDAGVSDAASDAGATTDSGGCAMAGRDCGPPLAFWVLAFVSSTIAISVANRRRRRNA